MRMLGRVIAFFVLVFSAHWALLALHPGITEGRIPPRDAAVTMSSSAARR